MAEEQKALKRVSESLVYIKGIARGYKAYNDFNSKKSPEAKLDLVIDKIVLGLIMGKSIISQMIVENASESYENEKVKIRVDETVNTIEGMFDLMIADLKSASDLISDPNSTIKRVEELLEAVVYNPDVKLAKGVAAVYDKAKNQSTQKSINPDV
jgi:hypothetical protein